MQCYSVQCYYVQCYSLQFYSVQCYLVRALRRFLYLAHLAVHSANTYSPLQAPQAAIDRHGYIKDEDRRTFSGMLYKLDESVGKVDTVDIHLHPVLDLQ